MLLTTILNHVQKLKSFVYKKAQWANAEKTEIDVLVEARGNSQPICRQYGRVGPHHGRQTVSRFSYLQVWGIPMTLVYAPIRVNCFWCGIRVESLPSTLTESSMSPLTKSYAWHLARWAKRLLWSKTAKAFQTKRDSVCQDVSLAAQWGQAHRDPS